MDERRDQGFEVAPTRIGGSTGPGRSARRRRAPLVLIALLAVAIPLIAWVGPRIEWRPAVDLSFLRPTPTPLPSATARPVFRPTPGLATPLPAITIGVGPRPTERFPVDVGGVRLADPTTGALGPPLGFAGSNDAIFTGAGGGWWCVCFTRASSGGNEETATVKIRRVDPSGRVTFHETVGEYRSSGPVNSDYANRFDLELGPGNQTAYLASGSRTGGAWAFAVQAIDLRTGKVVGRSDLGAVTLPEVPDPTPSPDEGPIEQSVAGPFMRLSPDGRRILVWAYVETYTPSGLQVAPAVQGWLVDVDPGAPDGSVGRLTTLDASFASRLRQCYWTAWTTEDEIASVCWSSDPGRDIAPLTLNVFTSDGTVKGHVDIASETRSWMAEPVFDRTSRLVFLWQPNDHLLQRIDLDRLRIEELTVDPQATGSGPAGPGSGAPRDWASFSSDLRLYHGPQLLGEPGTSRLFALGILPGEEGRRGYSFTSTGIWVFDATDLALVDRWDAVAAYGSIGLSPDLQWMFAIGTPGTDEDGNPADWQASITVHDLSDGRPALQLGSLGTDVPVLQVPP